MCPQLSPVAHELRVKWSHAASSSVSLAQWPIVGITSVIKCIRFAFFITGAKFNWEDYKGNGVGSNGWVQDPLRFQRFIQHTDMSCQSQRSSVQVRIPSY